MSTKAKTPTLLRFDRSSMPVSRCSIPTLSMGRTGIFRLNPVAVDLTGAAKRKGVVLLQDPDEPSNWFLAFDDQDGFPLRNGKYGMEFNCKQLVARILKSLDTEHACGTMRLADGHKADDGTQVWPILTSTLSYSGRNKS